MESQSFKDSLKQCFLGLYVAFDTVRSRFWMSDRKYIEYKYKKRLGRALDLDNPVTFNEKNNWRKLNDRNPMYTDMVDKYRIKGVISQRLGEEFTFPLLASWKRARNIDISDLPDKFVLKCNHAGGVIICRHKASFDLKKAKRELAALMRYNYFLPSREWPYKNVERRIVCEKYMGEGLTDYKVYCFNGQPRYVFVWKNNPRQDGRKPRAVFYGAYDFDWNNSGIKIGYESCDEPVEKPECLQELKRCAAAMSQGTLFVRVDCYIIDNRVYIGETTFFPWGGFMRFESEDTNVMLGQLERLPFEEDKAQS